MVSSSMATHLCTIILDHFLTQLVTHPARGDNILDLVFTNSPDSFSTVQIVDSLPGTDHDAILIS